MQLGTQQNVAKGKGGDGDAEMEWKDNSGSDLVDELP